jgi:preprotein translocase subunit SecG
MILIGIVFVWSVLLQSPKGGGIWMWIGGASASSSNEYGSK